MGTLPPTTTLMPQRTGAGGRTQRHEATLARWPVLDEAWARRIEQRRRQGIQPARPMPGVVPPSELGITPLTAINRAMGLPDDHGSDEVTRRRS